MCTCLTATLRRAAPPPPPPPFYLQATMPVAVFTVGCAFGTEHYTGCECTTGPPRAAPG